MTLEERRQLANTLLIYDAPSAVVRAVEAGEIERDKARAIVAIYSGAKSAVRPAAKAPVADPDAKKRREFLATRPDLSAEMRAAVKDLPLKRVRAIVNAIPRTRATDDPELLRIDRMMGLAPEPSAQCENIGTTLYLGAAPIGARTQKAPGETADDAELLEIDRKMGLGPKAPENPFARNR